MRSEPAEDYGAGNEEEAGDPPEIGGQFVMPLPEPDVVDKAFAIPLDDIVDRVELDHVEILDRQHLGRPEDRRHPEQELEHHVDDLSHVAEEDDH